MPAITKAAFLVWANDQVGLLLHVSTRIHLLEAADTLSVFVDGVPLVGPVDVGAAGGPLEFAPVGPAPTLRFADTSRPSEGEEWELRSYALEATGPVPTAVLMRRLRVAIVVLLLLLLAR